MKMIIFTQNFVKMAYISSTGWYWNKVLKFGIGFFPREKTNTKFQYHPVTKEKFRETNAFWEFDEKLSFSTLD